MNPFLSHKIKAQFLPSKFQTQFSTLKAKTVSAPTGQTIYINLLSTCKT